VRQVFFCRRPNPFETTNNLLISPLLKLRFLFLTVSSLECLRDIREIELATLEGKLKRRSDHCISCHSVARREYTFFGVS
jgi:hypothetical protein